MSEVARSEMVCQTGTVIKYESGMVYITIDKDEHCESCGAKGTCGAMLAGDKPVEVKYHKELQKGQKVEIGMLPGAIVKASIILFIVPAVAFVVGIALGYWVSEFFEWAQKQWTGFLLGLILTSVTYWVIRIMTPRMEEKTNYEPVITRILS